MTSRLPRHLLVAVVLFAADSLAFAATQTATDWFGIRGSGKIDKTDMTAPVIGTGATHSARNVTVGGIFPGVTLGKAGEFVEITGTLEILGGVPGSHGQFRFGLFDVNGMPSTTGWLGYYVPNASGPDGVQLMKRKAGNTTIAITGNSIDLAPVGPVVKAGTVFRTGAGNLFDFSVRYTREPDNSLTVVWSLIKQGGDYTTTGTCNDKAPLTYTFNRAAFLFGDVLAADKVNLSKVALTYESEPGAESTSASGETTSVSPPYGLFGAGVGALAAVGGVAAFVILRRRRRPGPVIPSPVIPPPEISPPEEASLPPPPGAE